MSKTYTELAETPPKLWVKDDAKELRIHTVSCMCDNKNVLMLKKNKENEFKLDGGVYSLANWQFRCEAYEIEWAADKEDWNEVFKLINTGMSLISEIRSR